MGFGKDDEDDNNNNQRRSPKANTRKDFEAKEMPGKDLKSQNRDNYNRDKNKPRKGNRRSPEEVEADISRLAKNVRNKHHQPQQPQQQAEVNDPYDHTSGGCNDQRTCRHYQRACKCVDQEALPCR